MNCREPSEVLYRRIERLNGIYYIRRVYERL
jgi:hypothetical protein